jgi:hypothetical protein
MTGRELRRWVVAGAMMALSMGAALADDQANFSRLLNDPMERQHVIDAAGRSAVVINNPCPSAQFTVSNRVVIYRAPTFEPDGTLGSGSWKQEVNQRGCGTERVLNVLVFVGGGKGLSTAPILPGTTRADPQLQKDAVAHAVEASGGREEHCQAGYVSDTRFVDQEAVAGQQAGPWREVWTLTSCTRMAQVPLRFIPDQNGTTIVAGPTSEVKVFSLGPGR